MEEEEISDLTVEEFKEYGIQISKERIEEGEKEVREDHTPKRREDVVVKSLLVKREFMEGCFECTEFPKGITCILRGDNMVISTFIKEGPVRLKVVSVGRERVMQMNGGSEYVNSYMFKGREEAVKPSIDYEKRRREREALERRRQKRIHAEMMEKKRREEEEQRKFEERVRAAEERKRIHAEMMEKRRREKIRLGKAEVPSIEREIKEFCSSELPRPAKRMCDDYDVLEDECKGWRELVGKFPPEVVLFIKEREVWKEFEKREMEILKGKKESYEKRKAWDDWCKKYKKRSAKEERGREVRRRKLNARLRANQAARAARIQKMESDAKERIEGMFGPVHKEKINP